MLIAEAFAGDDVVAEFEAEKAADAAEEAPHIEDPCLLPGWGAWAVHQKQKPAWFLKKIEENRRYPHKGHDRSGKASSCPFYRSCADTQGSCLTWFFSLKKGRVLPLPSVLLEF